MDLLRMAIAAVVAIVVGIPFVLATRHMRPAGEKEWQDAAQAGRVTTGTLTDKVFLPPDMSSQYSKCVKYDGKPGTTILWMGCNMPTSAS